MNKTVNVFLPMRAGSERVPKKNTKKFAGVDGGLCKIKLEQLIACDLIKTVFISTDDPEVVEISNGFNSKKIKVILRPKELASDSAVRSDVIFHALNYVKENYVEKYDISRKIQRNTYDALFRQRV